MNDPISPVNLANARRVNDPEYFEKVREDGTALAERLAAAGLYARNNHDRNLIREAGIEIDRLRAQLAKVEALPERIEGLRVMQRDWKDAHWAGFALARKLSAELARAALSVPAVPVDANERAEIDRLSAELADKDAALTEALRLLVATNGDHPEFDKLRATEKPT